MKFEDSDDQSLVLKKHPDYERNLHRARKMESPPDDRLYTFKIQVASSQWGQDDLVAVSHRTEKGGSYCNPVKLQQPFTVFSREFYDTIRNCILFYLDENAKLGRPNAHLQDPTQSKANSWFEKLAWIFARVRIKPMAAQAFTN